MPDPVPRPRVGFSRILGLNESLALGFSVSLGLLVILGGRVVLPIAGDMTPLNFLLAGLLYLPVILGYSELAAGRPGSASPYQISRSQGWISANFLVGWLMLAGLISSAALLAMGVATRLEIAFGQLLDGRGDPAWFLSSVVVLAGLNEWLTSEDRWRLRTLLVWIGLAILALVTAWAGIAHPLGAGELPTVDFEGHDLAAVALLAAGLWSVDLLLNHRRQMRRPDRTLRASVLGVWVATALLGAVMTSLALRSPSLLMENWAVSISWGQARLEFLLLLSGILFCWLGLSRTVTRTVRLTGAMTSDGFLPRMAGTRVPRAGALTALVVLGITIVLVARWASPSSLLSVSAVTFLLATVLVMGPHARRPARELDPGRRNRLPLHPLFPGLAIAAAVGFSLVLLRLSGGIVIGWLAIGGVYFLAYARRRAAVARQEESVVGEVAELGPKEAPRLMVAVGDTRQLPSLLRVGSALAATRDAELIVLRVVPTADELSLHAAQSIADEEWESLERAVGEAIPLEGIVTLVRIAPSVDSGIAAASREYDVDLLITGAPDLPREAAPSALLSRLFSSTSRPLIMLRGEVPEGGLRLVVGTAGGPHAPAALRLGDEIARGTAGSVELVSVAPRSRPSEEADEAIRRTVERAELESEAESRVVEADSVESGLLEISRDKHLLVLGSSVDRLLGQTVLGGLPMEIGRVREGATLVVKRAEAAMRFWQRRLWQILARATPTLTVSERSQVYSQMRQAARADVDFYTLISLSSAIAVLGLLLNSAAVIIGAMLVAPLMSPILATAQGIVQGNPLLIQRAGASTFKGMSVAVAVSAGLTVLMPAILPGSEILARASPNLLDLGVALAAGAAAAYAVSRASVAAALPGVAISVALVPPLCVVGYGLGSSRFSIAGGALLLFLTNLAAIVLVGALVFVLLGFRPTRAERDIHVRRAAVVSGLSVALLVIPLGLSTLRVTRQDRLEAEIRNVIRREADSSLRVERFSISPEGVGFLVEGTVYTFAGFETEKVFELQRRLERTAGVPVQVRLTIVPATRVEAGVSGTEAARP